MDEGASWALWESLAKDHSDFGRPSVFNSNATESQWLSFTVTLRDPTFLVLMEHFTGYKAGTGGLVTIADSNWLMSAVVPYQPHFVNQPDDVSVCWGYGLFVNEEGNFVKKKMSDCTGEDLLVELWRHLRFDDQIPRMLQTATCIPCMMPFITSHRCSSDNMTSASCSARYEHYCTKMTTRRTHTVRRHLTIIATSFHGAVRQGADLSMSATDMFVRDNSYKGEKATCPTRA